MSLEWPKVKRFLLGLERRMKETPDLNEWDAFKMQQEVVVTVLEEMLCELGQHDYTFLKLVSNGVMLQCRRCKHISVCPLTRTIH